MTCPRPWMLFVVLLGVVGLMGGLLAWGLLDRNPTPWLTIRMSPPVKSYGFLADERLFLTTDATGTKVWDLATREPDATATAQGQFGSGTSQDRRRYVVWNVPDQAVEWGDLAPRTVRAKFPVVLPIDTLLPSLTWLDEDRQIQLVTAQPGRTSTVSEVFTWEIASGRETRRTVNGPGSPFRFPTAFAADGRTWIYYNPAQDLFQLWDAARDQPIGSALTFPPRAPGGGLSLNWRGASFTPDGQVVITSHDDGRVGFWDVATQRLLKTVPVLPRGYEIYFVNFSPDGRTIAVDGSLPPATTWLGQGFDQIRQWLTGKSPRELSERIVILDRSTGLPLASLPRVIFAGFSPDSRWFATFADAGTIRIYPVHPPSRP